ncbi:MAG: hypothetical protein WD689_06135 [Gaiellaceae bacterium]
MTSSYLGLAALDAVLLLAGFGLLVGLGLVRSGWDALRHAGLALVAGWAAVGVAGSVALVLGAPLDWWVVSLLALALAAGGLLLARRVGAYRLSAVREPGPAAWVAVAGAAVVVVQLADLFRRSASAAATTEWDAWAFWLPKAISIVEFGGLDTAEGGFTSFAGPNYPPLLPALEASAFAFMGDTGAVPLAVQHWVVAAAFVAALASLLSVRVRPAVLWPSLAMLVLLPTFTVLVGSSLGDEALMLLLALGGACGALWVLERDPRYAVLTGLFLAAAALTKNEGPAIAVALGATMLGVALVRRPRRLLAPALVLVAPLAALAPWSLWIRLNDVPAQSDYRGSDLLDPGVLADRLDRLSFAARELPAYLFEPGRWLLALPLMLAAVVLAAPRRPALSLLAFVHVGAVTAGLLVVYWIGSPPVDFYVATTAGRLPALAVVPAAVYLPLLLAEASRPKQPPG